MRLGFFSFLFVSVFLWCGMAVAQEKNQTLMIDLAEDHVNITTGFTGADIMLFGVKDKPGEIVILLEGPKIETMVRKKEQVMGAWINRAWLNFQDVFSYYDYAMNVPEDDAFMSKQSLADNDIGFAALEYDPVDKRYNAEMTEDFKEALVRNRQNKQLYPIKPQIVTWLNDQFFRASFHLPANVPHGVYTVRALLVQNGKVVSKVDEQFTVAQIGFSSNVNLFAEHYSFAYGVLCILIAVFAGWISNVIVRRNI